MPDTIFRAYSRNELWTATIINSACCNNIRLDLSGSCRNWSDLRHQSHERFQRSSRPVEGLRQCACANRQLACFLPFSSLYANVAKALHAEHSPNLRLPKRTGCFVNLKFGAIGKPDRSDIYSNHTELIVNRYLGNFVLPSWKLSNSR